jgi:hypothetical protein
MFGFILKVSVNCFPCTANSWRNYSCEDNPPNPAGAMGCSPYPEYLAPHRASSVFELANFASTLLNSPPMGFLYPNLD